MRFFELASWLRVNFHKSKVGGIGVDNLMIDRFSILLNCSKIGIPFIYLDMPVGGNHRNRDFWNSMVDKIRKKLPNGEGRFFPLLAELYSWNL